MRGRQTETSRGALHPDPDLSEEQLSFVGARLAQGFGDSQRSLRVMMDALPGCIAYVDREQRYQFVNRTYELWFDIPQEGMFGRHVRDVLGEAAYEDIREYIASALNGVAEGFEYTAKYKHGGAREVYVDYVPDRNSNSQVVGFYALISDISEAKRAERQLETYQQRLQALTREVFLVEERERRRIAVELHDGILQTLAVVQMKVSSLRKTLGTTPEANLAEEIGDLTGQLIGETRSLAFQLSPPVLYELGLGPALHWLADRERKRHGLSYDISYACDMDIDKDVEIAIFQSIRELWANAGKHGQAARISTNVAVSESHIEIRVEDDGCGFDPAAITAVSDDGGFGLFSIRVALDWADGDFELDSAPGEGTRVLLKIPLESL